MILPSHFVFFLVSSMFAHFSSPHSKGDIPGRKYESPKARRLGPEAVAQPTKVEVVVRHQRLRNWHILLGCKALKGVKSRAIHPGKLRLLQFIQINIHIYIYANRGFTYVLMNPSSAPDSKINIWFMLNQKLNHVENSQV